MQYIHELVIRHSIITISVIALSDRYDILKVNSDLIMKKCQYCINEIEDEDFDCNHFGKNFLLHEMKMLLIRWVGIISFCILLFLLLYF